MINLENSRKYSFLNNFIIDLKEGDDGSFEVEVRFKILFSNPGSKNYDFENEK